MKIFFSLNKKFFFTISLFFLLCATIFIIIFDGIIGKKIRAEHSNIITRNQYVIELLNENIALKKTLHQILPAEKQPLSTDLHQKQQELTHERHINEELNQNYNENYATLAESLRIISLGAALTLISLIILWFLLRRWVIRPLDKLTLLSVAVANGDFSQRFNISSSRMTDEFDTLMQTINFMLDNIENNISEIKQKEIFLQNLIDALPDAIRIIDKDHNIVLSNKTYTKHLRRKEFNDAEKCYASYEKNALLPCNSAQYVCPLAEFKNNKKLKEIKLIHSIKNKPYSINSAQITFKGKAAIVESIRDLSENIHYSHQQKISSLGFLSTSLAHEMKNNLGAINIILNGIMQKYYTTDTKENSEQKKYLEMISSQISDCLNIPERLLKLARNDQPATSCFNAVNNINEILSLLDYEIKRKGIFVIKEFANSNFTLKGNETDFKMVILNLIQNAINAMENGGDLTISTATAAQQFNIIIKDSGCGISKTDLIHIFEPFYSSSTTANKKGTGLGLAIVKDILNQFNAQITVESTLNVGTCFKISFPPQKAQKMLVK